MEPEVPKAQGETSQPETAPVAAETQPQTPSVNTPEVSTPPEVVPPPTPPEPKKKNPILIIAVLLFALSLIAIGVYVAVSRGLFVKTKACTMEARVCPDGSSVGRVGPNCEFAPCPEPTQSPDPTAGWTTYTSSVYGFSLKHPADFTVNEDAANSSVSFMKVGPTQKEGTEFFDGVSVTATVGSLGGKTLKEYVDTLGKNDPVAEIVSGPSMVTVAGQSAYKVTIRGLTELDYYYFQKGTGGYLEIAIFKADPSGVGFVETAELILESLVILETSATPTATSSATPAP